ncbi:heavy metal translocating P-type ATPase [Mucilaginibacter myungsuensis]|uniref:Heavy metal translocating P-type ATPase metal-binding domain-containing protein n=1 Tax=Mucilaginibacter myungsuensis TaxID=649104 RepID=A0A929L5Q0_9SPHI|nr:heavy metal translocating P-type ATPase metal-binding domain-containing protein [Mucilaginibacter myungsuensis]MBE9664470.1 heavy metal translocating P-type ATPase metal-binding domain-containing protein [Mucilaginibacter myungsuensis]MDN3601385.1 heavy metal translocating P-type ATPase metal-binding domain-containing protein [Mucilaginibacter myungsuensis]
MTAHTLLEKETCYHCGDERHTDEYQIDDKHFCCQGCQTVYQVLAQNQLCSYYNFNAHPGETRKRSDKRFEYLSEPTIIKDLIDYRDEQITVVSFYIPHIHCSSCLWLLEQLNKLNPAVHYCRVDFLKKQLSMRFDHRKLSLQGLVELLYDIGYEPLISLQDVIKKNNSSPKDNLVQKIAVAGFCFGNVMLLSFPEYFGLTAFEQNFKHFFGWLNVAFGVPVVVYSGWGYFTSAYQNLRNKVLNIDFPLALGIAVLFIRTAVEVATGTGAGFADTLCGLVFFLLVGKFVQQKTYHHISFERDYRSFFPVAVQVVKNGVEKPLPLAQLQTGHRMVVRNNEIIPADAILLKGEAMIDLSFVTGEAIPVHKTLGEVIYAGGRQTGQAIELEVIKPVSQSYLTQLWNNEAFTAKQDNRVRTFNEEVSKHFTIILLAIAIGSLLFWALEDLPRGIAAFTAVLIVACPCALALSTPFTMSAALSVFDKNLFYLKNTAVVEQMARIDTIVMDKTGTITIGNSSNIQFNGVLSAHQQQLIWNTCSNSNHPLSRMICSYLGNQKPLPISNYNELAGKGIEANVDDDQMIIGSADMIFGYSTKITGATRVHVSQNGLYLGYFAFHHQYREGMDNIPKLSDNYDMYLLSGDQDHEATELVKYFRPDAMHFEQLPQQKMDLISDLQHQQKKVMMLGDGLNDAGALKQSDLGVAVTDNVNNFTPGSDAILDGRSFSKLPQFLRFAKDTVKIIHISFLISLTYNVIGLTYAVTGQLSPLTAAVLMPLSTATIISFTSLATHFAARKRRLA